MKDGRSKSWFGEYCEVMMREKTGWLYWYFNTVSTVGVGEASVYWSTYCCLSFPFYLIGLESKFPSTIQSPMLNLQTWLDLSNVILEPLTINILIDTYQNHGAHVTDKLGPVTLPTFSYMYTTDWIMAWQQSYMLPNCFITQMLNFTCKRCDRWRDFIDTLLIMYSCCAVCCCGDSLHCVCSLLRFTVGCCRVDDRHSLPHMAFCAGVRRLNVR